MKKELTLSLDDYTTALRVNKDALGMSALTWLIARHAAFNGLSIEDLVKDLYRINPDVKLIPGKSQFIIKGLTSVSDEFYGYKHFKSINSVYSKETTK